MKWYMFDTPRTKDNKIVIVWLESIKPGKFKHVDSPMSLQRSDLHESSLEVDEIAQQCF